MSMKFMRKTAVVVAATTLLGGGLAVGVGQGVAGAAECGLSAEVGAKNNYKMTKKVVSPSNGSVYAGGRVTYHITITGGGGLIDAIKDYHPTGFELESVRLNVKTASGQKWVSNSDVYKENDVSRGDNYVRVAAPKTLGIGGWTTSGGTVTLETTYKVPQSAKLGAVYDSGAAFQANNMPNTNADDSSMGVCVTVGTPNLVDGAFSSLEGLGLGSVEDGVDGVTGSATNPTGSIADVINQIDIGKIIGGVIGGAVGS